MRYTSKVAGIARAFKAPNLYQTSEGYLLYSKGNGCPKILRRAAVTVGNKNLDLKLASIKRWAGIYRRRLPRKRHIISVTIIRIRLPQVIKLLAEAHLALMYCNGRTAVSALIEGIETSMAVRDAGPSELEPMRLI